MGVRSFSWPGVQTLTYKKMERPSSLVEKFRAALSACDAQYAKPAATPTAAEVPQQHLSDVARLGAPSPPFLPPLQTSIPPHAQDDCGSLQKPKGFFNLPTLLAVAGAVALAVLVFYFRPWVIKRIKSMAGITEQQPGAASISEAGGEDDYRPPVRLGPKGVMLQHRRREQEAAPRLTSSSTPFKKVRDKLKKMKHARFSDDAETPASETQRIARAAPRVASPQEEEVAYEVDEEDPNYVELED